MKTLWEFREERSWRGELWEGPTGKRWVENELCTANGWKSEGRSGDDIQKGKSVLTSHDVKGQVCSLDHTYRMQEAGVTAGGETGCFAKGLNWSLETGYSKILQWLAF